MTETTTWGQIQGTDITFPMEVTDFDAATLLFSVPSAPAAQLLPGDDFEVVELIEGVGQLVIALCDYHENPWGDYLEINLGLLARPKGAPADVIGSFVYRMPVDQAFTCQAGNEVMGFPKTVEDLSVSRSATDLVRFTWRIEGEEELSIALPQAPPAGEPGRVETVSYSYLHGVAHETPLAMDMGTGVIEPSEVEIRLGDGLAATELKRLGLPKAPDFVTWGTGLTATFGLGRPVSS
jgi:hypothetical protein